jgi:hypothetical protein
MSQQPQQSLLHLNTYQQYIYFDVLKFIKLPNELKIIIVHFFEPKGYENLNKCVLYMKKNLRISYSFYKNQINKIYYLFDRTNFPETYNMQQDDYAIMLQSWNNKRQRIGLSFCEFCGHHISFCAKDECTCDKSFGHFDYDL